MSSRCCIWHPTLGTESERESESDEDELLLQSQLPLLYRQSCKRHASSMDCSKDRSFWEGLWASSRFM